MTSIILTSIVAIIAVASPLATLLINNHYQYLRDTVTDENLSKQKRIQRQNKQIESEITIISNYLSETACLITTRDSKMLNSQSRSFGAAIVYADSGLAGLMNDLQTGLAQFEDSNITLATSYFPQIYSRFIEEVSQLRSKLQ